MQISPRFAVALIFCSTCFGVAQTACAQRVSDLSNVPQPAASVLTNPGAVPIAENHTPTPVDSIAAVVNGDIITREELTNRMVEVVQRSQAQHLPVPDADDLQHQVLEQMIMEKAQLQLAKEYGITVNDAILNKTVENIAAGNNLSLPEFRRQLGLANIPYEGYLKELTREITLDQLHQREIDNKVTVPEAEIDNYLATQELNAKNAVEVKMAVITIRAPENATPEQFAATQQRAEEAMSRLRAGDSFADVSAKYSDAAEAASSGELGWRDQAAVPQLFTDAVANLQPDQITPILRSPIGFHIIKFEDRRSKADEASGPVKSTHVRHILLKITANLNDGDAKNRLVALRQRLENKTDTFEDLAKLYSNDGSADKGGDLGWVFPGDTVPEFERAMDALKPGEISEPVHSQFGWHLIQVLERKSDDASKERKRQAARKTLREQKTAEATADWLRELRDRTYVEIRNNNQ
jgi:peptidyl-prolyl cis-trans isomerase SurA